MTKPKLKPGENWRYNTRDAKGRFAVTVGISDGIAATCRNCGKVFNAIKTRILESDGLCGICFHTQA